MKRILIVSGNMHIGGVQKALVNLLWNIQDQYEVTLLLFGARGPYMADIPPNVRVLPVRSAYRFLGLTRDDVDFPDKIGRAFFGAVTRIFGRKRAVSLMALGQEPLRGYDVAISYLHDPGERAFYGGCNEFVLRHVEAGKKVAFLHCDYIRAGADTKENALQYARFDTVAACSEGCKSTFILANPSLRGRTVVVPNCHRYGEIRAQADLCPVEMSSHTVNVVTVARLGKEKGVGRAVQAMELLGKCNARLHYYIVGDGAERGEIQRKIRAAGLTERVTLCGELPNPYGYMRAADLLLIPSRSEAAPLVIDEAACLGTPILSTSTSSAEEMIVRRGFGWVCENSELGMAEALRELIGHPERLKEKGDFLGGVRFCNDEAVAQFARAIED